ncbi:uncharacterized protein CEXT_664431 [Caerostris extrusa]|uniref:Aminopeptidase N-like N-terminal domain-containing protein n=1 Tax=Caerostris extrusa TaxID=172846 RepID=A0AAV4SX39_CAEEX|nr:uncharacterized protein CEXT_664431 [Caerostris extrusa]
MEVAFQDVEKASFVTYLIFDKKNGALSRPAAIRARLPIGPREASHVPYTPHPPYRRRHGSGKNGARAICRSKAGEQRTRRGMDSHSGKDKQRKGYFVPHWALLGAGALAALLVLVVGLLVGYLAPCGTRGGGKDNGEDELPKTLPYVRLPRSVVPDHYDLELQPFIYPGNFTFSGKVRILIRVLEATDNVTLHINNVTVREESVRLTGPNAPSLKSVSEDKERQFFILHLGGELVAGHHYEVSMEYVGSLNDQLAGFYRSSYKDPQGETR